MAEDTPTHRIHILQGKLQQIVAWTQQLQQRRAVIVERIARATSNTKIARALNVERSLERSITSMLRDLQSSNDKLNKIADRLNKCRGLLLELSDGEVFLEKTERINGPDTRDELHVDPPSVEKHEEKVHRS